MYSVVQFSLALTLILFSLCHCSITFLIQLFCHTLTYSGMLIEAWEHLQLGLLLGVVEIITECHVHHIDKLMTVMCGYV